MSNDLFQISITPQAIRSLKKIDHNISLQIRKKISLFLIKSPRELGKPLGGRYKGLYRYRYGDYRIVYEIIESTRTIIVNKIGHRSDVYEQ